LTHILIHNNNIHSEISLKRTEGKITKSEKKKENISSEINRGNKRRRRKKRKAYVLFFCFPIFTK